MSLITEFLLVVALSMWITDRFLKLGDKRNVFKHQQLNNRRQNG